MTYKTNKISCLGCLNLTMCGRDKKKRVRVHCVQNKIEGGRKFLLIDMLNGRIGTSKGCESLEGMRVKKDIPWRDYIEELRHNFT